MESIDRRKLLTMAGAGLAAVAASEATAEAQDQLGGLNVQGEWFNPANNRPCAVFQAGSILLLVNENGNIASAIIQGNRVSIMQGWNVNKLEGLITNQVIRFTNGSEWRRA